ncbi:MAG: hypothetical protein C7B45_12370 [Sulfobacillus acidophilus]|uniref:Uncharacterized protein n=1 Tax=Sulfobacillus acidophilus TaxID=53633 RepID=A0A2T2WFL5_9FIRM|nr:MAG: hypothetical protein C7B45_12370 [Sulfobacillus acidophilus]
MAWSQSRQHHLALKLGVLRMLGAMTGARTDIVLSHHVPIAWVAVAVGLSMLIHGFGRGEGSRRGQHGLMSLRRLGGYCIYGIMKSR